MERTKKKKMFIYKNRLPIHFCVLAYIHGIANVVCILSYFRKLYCNGEAHTLLISYRVHRAHTLLIDVISYSNYDTAFSCSPQ